MQYVIRTDRLSKRYKGKAAVDAVNLQVKTGEIYGFVGENGAGKSTTLKMILNIVFPDEGTIELFGESDPERYNRPEIRRQIGGYVDTPRFYDGLSAADNLEITRRAAGAEHCRTTADVLELVQLADVGRKPVAKFSLGMRQRLAIARALITRPRLLILDEPLNGLDPSGIQQFRRLIGQMSQNENITVVISSHLLLELEKIATVYGFIHQGKLTNEITASELQNSLRPFIEILTSQPGQIRTALAGLVHPDNVQQLDDRVLVFEQLDQFEPIRQRVESISEAVRFGRQDLEMYYMDLPAYRWKES